METQISNKKMVLLLLAGILGCLCMGASDWLMIYGDTAFEGSLAWLTVGVAAIAPWRFSVAMMLAFPAVVFYSLGLYCLRHFFREETQKKTYCALTSLGMTPWLCLHLFYVMILFSFSWLNGNGQGELALTLGETLFHQLGWVVMVGQIFMILPFLYLLYVFFTVKTNFPRLMAANNPLVIYLVLKAFTGLLPDTPFRLAFINGLMSESMLICFAVFLIVMLRTSRKR